jgi:thiol-disulfide isomerase/thioredoxin
MKTLRSALRPIRIPPVAVAIAASLLLTPLAQAAEQAGETASGCAVKPYVVKIHADWCGRCRATQETWARILTELGGEATVIELDVSDRAAYQASLEEAERLGIRSFFREYRRRTGVIAVLDCRTLEPVVVLAGERDFDKVRDAVRKAARPS